jgi:hypothetical protein
LVIALAFSGNNTFNMGTVSFEYPNSWSQESVVGNFNSSSLYSQVTLTSNFADANGQYQPAYIIIQMQQKSKGTLNLPSTSALVTNTSNSSVASTSVNNINSNTNRKFWYQHSHKIYCNRQKQFLLRCNIHFSNIRS